MVWGSSVLAEEWLLSGCDVQRAPLKLWWRAPHEGVSVSSPVGVCMSQCRRSSLLWCYGFLTSIRGIAALQLWGPALDSWTKQWQPTPVLLPSKSHGWRSLVGCSPWGRRVRHDWSDLAPAAAAALDFLQGASLHWRQKVSNVISWGTPLELYLGNPLQFWPETPSIIWCSGPFSCASLGILWNYSGELGMPRGSFRVVVETPLELQWGRSSIVVKCKLVPV